MAIETIDYEKCNDCGICYETCPMDVFRKAGPKVYIRYPADCMACYLCELDCPTDAIYVSPERAQRIVQVFDCLAEDNRL